MNNRDIKFLNDQVDSILGEASRYIDKDITTKKEYILRLKEKIITLFEMTKRPMPELASYISTKLSDIGFQVADSWFYTLFNEGEKANYPAHFSTEIFSKWIDRVEKNVTTGQIKIDNIIYSPDTPSEVKTKTLKGESDETTLDNTNKYIELLKLIGETANRLNVTCDAIIQRYDDNHLLIKTALEPIAELQDKYANYYAVISNSKDVLDDRNKWGDYEKIMAKYLMDSGETIAHVAKLMDYSSKFGSIGILNNEALQHKVHQLGLCPSCNADIYFTMNTKLKELEVKAQFEV